MAELIVNRRKYFDEKNKKRKKMLEMKPTADEWGTRARCLRCSWEWETRTTDPKRCPKCGYRFRGAKQW